MTTTRTVRMTGTNTPAAGGPNPGVLGVITLGLLIGSLILMAALSGGSTIGSPYGDTTDVAGFFADNGFAVRAAAMLQLGSSITLGIYAAIVYARQRRLGIRVPGPSIGLFGGTAAAVLLAVSACVTWTQAQPVVSAQPELTHALAFVSFVIGGVAHVLGLGVLVAGIAVPALMLRLLPVPLTVTGLAIAFLAELSVLSMAFEPAQLLIPVGRFGALVWIVIAGFLLPKTRHSQEAGA